MNAKVFVLTVAAAAFVAGVGGCGKKGPLYLPKPAAPASAPAADNAAASAPEKSPPANSPEKPAPEKSP